MTVKANCATCGAYFERHGVSSKQKAPRFCSQRCWLKAHNSPERNRELGRRSRDKIRARHLDSGACVSYRKFYGRHEHRVVVEQMIGRQLRPNEIVHHIDGNKRNNAPENLQIVTRREHMLIHLPEMHRANAEKRAAQRKGGDA